MPSDYGLWFDDDEGGAPIGPSAGQACPEITVRSGQFGPLHGALQNAQLVSQREVLQVERSSRFERRRDGDANDTERAENGTDEVPDEARPPSSHSVRDLRQAQSGRDLSKVVPPAHETPKLSSTTHTNPEWRSFMYLTSAGKCLAIPASITRQSGRGDASFGSFTSIRTGEHPIGS